MSRELHANHYTPSSCHHSAAPGALVTIRKLNILHRSCSDRRPRTHAAHNLAHQAHRGQSESTTVRLQLAPTVENVGVFAFVDPLMQSLRTGSWEMLQTGLPSVSYTWKKTLTELELHTYPGIALWGIAPHMHERGRKYQMRIRTAEGAPAQCGVDVQRWSFHWPRLYAYRSAWPVGPSSEFEVTCEYDTTDATMPVLPGWGTNNEMCLAALYFTMPASSYGL